MFSEPAVQLPKFINYLQNLSTIKVGNDRLKYVYDFGDWVEHVLTLKAIVEPEKKVSYPREVARNKPKIQYCTVCQEEGKKVAAKWVCVTCSNELGVETLLCDEHAADEEHEDHYTVEILS